MRWDERVAHALEHYQGSGIETSWATEEEARAHLARIRVLWRQCDLRDRVAAARPHVQGSPDSCHSLALWGLPHDLRPGQTPWDLWRARRVPDPIAAARGRYPATRLEPGPGEGWVWLGRPGWWGALGEGWQRAIRAFLAEHPAPDQPGEWVAVTRMS